MNYSNKLKASSNSIQIRGMAPLSMEIRLRTLIHKKNNSIVHEQDKTQVYCPFFQLASKNAHTLTALKHKTKTDNPYEH